jgi:hypothetical protein
MRIHPFREGHDRLGRLLAVLMALHAGLPVLDFRPERFRAGNVLRNLNWEFIILTYAPYPAPSRGASPEGREGLPCRGAHRTAPRRQDGDAAPVVP